MKKIVLLSLIVLPMAAQLQTPAGTLSPSDVEAQQRRLDTAEDLLRASHFDQAKAQLQEALQVEPKNARALYDMGFAEEQSQHTDVAEASYRSAIQADPKQFESRFALALLLARKGAPEEAREQLATAVTLTPLAGDPVKAAAYRALAQLDRVSKPEEAHKELAAAIQLTMETDSDRELAKQIGGGSPTQSADSEESYRTALAAAPNDPRASAGLAQMLVKNGKLAEASDLLEKASAAHPQENILKQMLAHVYIQADEYDKALPILAELTQDPAAKPSLLDDYGNCLIRMSKPIEAQKAFERAVANPEGFASKQEYADTAEHLAFAASANHDADTVLRALAIHDGIGPPTTASIFLAATAHDRLHRKKLAIDGYQQFLKASGGKYPNEEWQARHRIIALQHSR